MGEVNGDFGTPEWQPVVYLRRSVNKQELAALYSAADVAWVGPLRDGMNLVAKEYVACQHEGDGVLVLSEFAGAAQELGEALRINPYDEVGTADTIVRALEMDAEERAERMAALHERVHRNDAVRLGRALHRGLCARRPHRRAQTMHKDRPTPDRQARCGRPSPEAERRLLLLDYDGTLVDIKPRPQDAAPDARAASTLLRTWRRCPTRPRPSSAADRGLTSSAGSATSPDLGLAVEHGALMREPGADGWEMLRGGMDLVVEGTRPTAAGAVRRQRTRVVRREQGATRWPGTTASSMPSSEPGWPTSW